jgi:drug/metabolite transporter (DMT)-like permease
MRPGGLTALAIFNFVFGGLAAIGGLINLATLGTFYDRLAADAAKHGQEFPSKGLLYALAALTCVRAGCLITSGIGYIGMRRFLGWVIGNAYAVLALGSVIFEITQAPQGLSVFNLVEFAYPLITLFLLDVIFRKDFTR